MTQEEYDRSIKIIEKHMHVDCLGNGSYKNVLDNHGLVYVKEELKEMVEK